MFHNYYYFDGENYENEFSYYYDENGTWIKVSDKLIEYISLLNEHLTDELIMIFHDEYQLGKRESFDKYVKQIEVHYNEHCNSLEKNKDKHIHPTPLVSKLLGNEV